jgi:hypothetical protein
MDLVTHLGAFREGQTSVYETTLVEEDEQPIDSGVVSDIRLTIRDLTSGQVIAGRSNVTVLNANGGTLGPGGAFRLRLTGADMATIGTTRVQRRLVTLLVTFTDGMAPNAVTYDIQNLQDVV